MIRCFPVVRPRHSSNSESTRRAIFSCAGLDRAATSANPGAGPFFGHHQILLWLAKVTSFVASLSVFHWGPLEKGWLPSLKLGGYRNVKSVNFSILREIQVSKAQSLRSKLGEFIERQDRQSRDRLTTDHTNAWKRALEFLSGKKPGTFGNELGSIRSNKFKG